MAGKQSAYFQSIRAAIKKTVDRLGPNLFVSVANAGITQVRPLLECTTEFIENEVRINVLGFMNTHIAAARQMMKQGHGGRILGAGSIASYRTTAIEPCTVRMTFGSMQMRLLLWIRQCGITLTENLPRSCENIPVRAAKAIRVQRDIKLGRIQEPEDVAKLVSFLVLDEGEYIAGQTIKTCDNYGGDLYFGFSGSPMAC
ncbi:unnamed protein product [Somion occarium]|uniref:Uncharacterized protein n=1 Tax=Somion occarium TaxID=3059160 RepID=A0ABP1E7Z7_9APHY